MVFHYTILLILVHIVPTMDICDKKYILATNFQRLRSVDPDYSYHCLPEMDEKTFLDYQNDGIWMYDIKKGGEEVTAFDS